MLSRTTGRAGVARGWPGVWLRVWTERLALVGLVAGFGCSGEDGPSRRRLLDELDAQLPGWSRAHLAVSTEDAFADCSKGELSGILDVFDCHRDRDLSAQCRDEFSDPIPRCYAEVSAHCRSLSDPSAACKDGFAAGLNAPDAPDASDASNDAASSTDQASDSLGKSPDCAASLTGARLASAAYEQSDVASALPSGFTLDKTFTGDDFGFAFTATSSGASGASGGSGTTCQVVFQGTADLTDWVEDAKLDHTNCVDESGTTIAPGDACELGFYEVYVALREKGLVDHVMDEMGPEQCPGGLHVYGHSLGAALASLLVGSLHLAHPETYDASFLLEYTYGEPRSVVETTANTLQNAWPKNRWTNWGDPVPSLPPTVAGYYHFGTAWEIYEDWTGKIYFSDEAQNFSPFGLVPTHHEISHYISRLERCHD